MVHYPGSAGCEVEYVPAEGLRRLDESVDEGSGRLHVLCADQQVICVGGTLQLRRQRLCQLERLHAGDVALADALGDVLDRDGEEEGSDRGTKHYALPLVDEEIVVGLGAVRVFGEKELEKLRILVADGQL